MLALKTHVSRAFIYTQTRQCTEFRLHKIYALHKMRQIEVCTPFISFTGRPTFFSLMLKHIVQSWPKVDRLHFGQKKPNQIFNYCELLIVNGTEWRTDSAGY